MNIYSRKIILIILLWGLIGQVHAGKLILKTELWDFICKVEVVVGQDVPVIIDQILEFPGVKNDGEYIDGVVFEAEGRLCYRRSVIVDDCHSPLNDWVCYTNSSDEDQIIPIY